MGGGLWLACWLVIAGGTGVTAQSPGAPEIEAKAAASGDSVATARFQERAEHLLNAAPVSKGEWGAMIVDADTGSLLYEKNADKYFLPASNMKLLTTALALDTLGPEYRFRTTLETNGRVTNRRTLKGDLILVGRGDANLSNRKHPFDRKEEFDGPPEKVLAELADALAAKGIKVITGDVVGDDSYFPRERYPDGWEIDDMVWEYGAAISAIVVNDNMVTLTLTAGRRAGDRVSAEMEPETGEFRVVNEVTTVGAKEKGDLRLTREPGADSVVVKGTLPAMSAPRKLLLAVQEPSKQAASMLARLLRERGIKVRGAIRMQHEPDPKESERKVLAEHLSIRLGDTVKLVNKISQNLHTEVLLRSAARQQGRWETPEELAKFPEGFYAKVGIETGDVIQTDGSGLSRHDLVTPRALVALLRYAEKQTWFPDYYASLPVAGVDGTLSERWKNSALTGRIHAKTGSVSHVRSLSGFAETAGGRRLIFSFLSNNQGGKNHETQDALDGLCVAMMEEFDGTKPEKEAVTK